MENFILSTYFVVKGMIDPGDDSVNLICLREIMVRPVRVPQLPVRLGQPDQQPGHHPRAVPIVQPDKGRLHLDRSKSVAWLT